MPRKKEKVAQKQQAQSAYKLSFNPWTSSLTRPRETIREIVNYNPHYLVLLIAVLIGISSTLQSITSLNTTSMSWPTIVAIILVGGSILGIISVYLGSWLLLQFGKLFKGQSTYAHMRAAAAWSSIPLVFILPFSILEILIYGRVALSSVVVGPGQIVFSLLDVIASIWSIILTIVMISEVQKFSIPKAIGNFMLLLIFTLSLSLILLLF